MAQLIVEKGQRMKLQILHLEDEPNDAQLVAEMLASAGFDCDIVRVDTREGFCGALQARHLDLILSDRVLPAFDGLSALQLARAKCPDVPFIFISGSFGEEAAIESLKQGATDYVFKDRLARLVPVTKRALADLTERHERKMVEHALAVSEQRFRALIERSAEAIILLDANGTVLYTSPAMSRILGASTEYWLGGNWLNRVHPEDVPIVSQLFGELLQEPLRSATAAFRYRHIDGRWLWLEATGTNMLNEPSVYGVVGNVRDITERKETEQALQASEERYRTLFESNPHPMWVFDRETLAFLAVNDAAVRHYGYSREEFLSLTIKDIRPPEELPALLQNFAQSDAPLHDRTSWRHLKKDGTVIEVEITSHALMWLGRPARLVLANDVTERKRAEQALVANEKRFRALIENSSEGITLLNLNGTLAYASDSVQRILGYPSDQVIGQDPKDIVHPDDQPIILGVLGQLLQMPGSIATTEYRMRHADGSWRWIESTINNMLAEPAIEAIVFNYRDITERKQAELALQHSEKRFRALIEHNADAIVLMNHEGTVFYASPSAKNISETPLADIIGRNGFANLHPDDVARTRNILGALLQNPGASAPFEARFRHRNGSWHWVEGTGTNLLQEPGVNALVGNYRDITERKLAQQEVERRANEFAMLYETARDLTATQDLSKLLETIVLRAMTLLNTPSGILYLYNPTTQELELSVDKNYAGPAISRVPLGVGIAGQVALTRQSIVVSDYSTWVHRSPYYATSFRTGMGVPLLYSGEFIGVLVLGDYNPKRILTETDRDLLTLFGSHAAGAVHAARLLVQTQLQVQRLRALRAIDMAINGSVDLHVTLNVSLEQVVSQLQVDAAAVLILNPSLNVLEYGAGRGFRTPYIECTSLRPGEGFAGTVVLARTRVEVLDLAAQRNKAVRPALLDEEKFVAYVGVPLITKGIVRGVLEIFHRSRLDPNVEWLEFLEALGGQVAIAIDNASLFMDLQRSNLELGLAYDATIEGWSRALDLRDKETEGHTLRVTEITERLARQFGIGDAELIHIRRGALLHDIGKMGVPDGILLKPGPLTDEEWTLMRMHPVYAYELMAPIAFLRSALDIPYCHHEKWDGTGYPRGLKGEQIPLAARLFAIVDVWDALRSDRPYRRAWSQEKVRGHIQSLSGTHFDPQVLDTFLQLNDLAW
jgi:PAS domain S-box-containing protein/putative nucleotidyltransferase with HDIG domain